MTNAKRERNTERSAPNQAGRSNTSFERTRLNWVSCYFDLPDREWLASEDHNYSLHICGFLDGLPLSYTVSSKYDSSTDRWLSTCICNDPSDVNHNSALTARGATRLDSLFALAYSHDYKLKGVWGGSADTDLGRWG